VDIGVQAHVSGVGPVVRSYLLWPPIHTHEYPLYSYTKRHKRIQIKILSPKYGNHIF